MKEIGECFKEARNTIGISKEEILKDMNITESQLDNLEDGNINAFKDVFFLKDIVKKYAKYLNLDEDEIIDKFNEFIFSYTSRIPVTDILEQTREINIADSLKEENKIISPYTKKKKEKNVVKYAIIYILAVIAIVVLIIFIINYVGGTKSELVNNYYDIMECIE